MYKFDESNVYFITTTQNTPTSSTENVSREKKTPIFLLGEKQSHLDQKTFEKEEEDKEEVGVVRQTTSCLERGRRERRKDKRAREICGV